MPEGTTPPIPEGGLTLTVGVLFVDAMVADSRAILAAVGYGSATVPRLDVGVGFDVDPAFVGIVQARVVDVTG